jgi:hypothetical protein
MPWTTPMRRVTFPLGLLLTGGACSSGEKATNNLGADTAAGAVVAAEARAPLTSTGLWLSDGYGQLYDIRGDSLIRYDLTSVSCLRTLAAVRAPTSDSVGRIAFFGSGSSGDFGGAQDAFTLSAGRDSTRRWLAAEGAISRIELMRTTQRPARCDAPADSSALATYDVFWTTFAEHYPFFAMKGIDWQRVNADVRPTITAKTTPNELFAIFRRLLEPLKDAHVHRCEHAQNRVRRWALRTGGGEIWAVAGDHAPFDLPLSDRPPADVLQ